MHIWSVYLCPNLESSSKSSSESSEISWTFDDSLREKKLKPRSFQLQLSYPRHKCCNERAVVLLCCANAPCDGEYRCNAGVRSEEEDGSVHMWRNFNIDTGTILAAVPGDAGLACLRADSDGAGGARRSHHNVCETGSGLACGRNASTYTGAYLQCLLLRLCALPYVLCAAVRQSKCIALARAVDKVFGKRNAFFW